MSRDVGALKVVCRRIRLSSAIVLLGIFAGCTTRAYSGPIRPESEISILTLHPVGEIAVQRFLIDGQVVSATSNNVQVLPGQHTFEIRSYIENQNDCPTGSFYCYTAREEGVCKGTVRSLPGRSYLITVENRNSLVTTRVSAKGYFDFIEREDEEYAGSGSCQGF